MTRKKQQTINDYVEQTFPVECRGRDENMNPVLPQAIPVTVKISKSAGSSIISTEAVCPYGANGGHGTEYCTASGKRTICPYSCDIPYAIEKLFKS